MTGASGGRPDGTSSEPVAERERELDDGSARSSRERTSERPSGSAEGSSGSADRPSEPADAGSSTASATDRSDASPDDPNATPEDPDQAAFDPAPPTLGVVLAAVAASVAVVATGVGSRGSVLALVGAVAVALGTARGSRKAVTLGAVACFCGVLVAAVSGLPPGFALLGAAGAVLAWDAGEHAIGVGAHVGTRARHRRALLVHAGASAAFAVAVVGAAYLAYEFARRGRGGAAVVVLAGAAALFAIVAER